MRKYEDTAGDKYENAKKANTRAPSRVPHVAEKDTNFIQLKFFIKNLKNGGLNTHLNACRKKKSKQKYVTLLYTLMSQ